MHVRVCFVVMCGKHVRTAIAELQGREIPRRITHGLTVCTRWHGQENIEDLAPRTLFRDAPTTQLPRISKITKRNAAAINERAEMKVIGGIEPRPILVSG